MIIGFILFPRVLAQCEQSGPEFELGWSCPFPTTITITSLEQKLYEDVGYRSKKKLLITV